MDTGVALFEGNFMGWHVCHALTFGCALALASLSNLPARAEFPPEGATSDPNNPSVASGDYPDPAHSGTMRHFIFYFDCGKRDWIGVSVAGTKGDQAAPPQAVGKGREFPSGPPPGSKVDTANSTRASIAGSGQTLSLRQGTWFDAKTGKPIASPNLCPGGSPDHTVNKTSKSSDGTASDQKPDQLPPPPHYLPDPALRSHP